MAINNAITLKDGVKYIPIISRRYKCPKCNIFCMELTPVFSREAVRRARAQGRMLQVKVFCKNGCHEKPDWSWEIFNWTKVTDRNRISDWPEEWREKKRR